MDWGKAKNVILIVLVLTNMFLIAVIGQKHLKQNHMENDVYAYTLNVLEENNIFYSGDLQNRTSRVHPLTVSYGKYDSSVVRNAISAARVLPEEDRTDEGYIAAADRLLDRCGFLKENAVCTGVDEKFGMICVSYKNVYKGIPVEECSMNVYFDGGRIVDFDRKWMEVVSSGDGKIEVSSKVSALLKFMSEREGNERIDITDMQMVYWIESYDIEGDVLYDTALPAWRIEYNNGKVAFISAS